MLYTDAASHPDLFGPWFTPAPSWATWRVVDAAIFGEPIEPQELPLFRALTGRSGAPTGPAREAWLAMGRRSGKSVKAASYAAYIATIRARLLGFHRHMTRGERGVVQVIAVDRDQAKVIMGYLEAMFTEQPALRKELAPRRGNASPITADSITLRSGLAIEVTTNDRRRVRGRTVVAAIFEEVAHWLASEQSVTPDIDVYRAVRPAMATIPGSLAAGHLLAICPPRAVLGAVQGPLRQGRPHPHRAGRHTDNEPIGR